MYACMDGWRDGWMDGWMDGWRIYRLSQIQNLFFASIKIRRICTSQDDFSQNWKGLKSKLTARGCKEEEIDEIINKPCNIQENKVLKKQYQNTQIKYY